MTKLLIGAIDAALLGAVLLGGFFGGWVAATDAWRRISGVVAVWRQWSASCCRGHKGARADTRQTFVRLMRRRMPHFCEH